jgi:hypothetical protein
MDIRSGPISRGGEDDGSLHHHQDASAGVITGITTLALAAPASAVNESGYSGGSSGSGTNTVLPGAPAESSAWDLAPIATGALGGLVLAGAGFAAVVTARRHSNMAHPA